MIQKKRFYLIMKNGAEVNTLPELQENYDVESVLTYFADGQLMTWLNDRYYSFTAEAIDALSNNMPDLESRIYNILCGTVQEKSNLSELSVLTPIDQKPSGRSHLQMESI